MSAPEKPTLADEFASTTFAEARVAPILADSVAAALASGLRVLAPHRASEADLVRAKARFVYVFRDLAGSFAVLSADEYSSTPINITAPIEPTPKYGSGVIADTDGTPADVVRSLSEICDSPTVQVRFVGLPAPVLPNRGQAALTAWGGGPENFIEIIAG